jgi:hypothetical protein
MTGAEFIQAVNDTLRSIDDDPPTQGTDEYALWMRMGSRLNRTRARDLTKQWRSDYQLLRVGTVSVAAAPSYDLDDTFLGAAADVYVVGTNTVRTDFDLVQPQEQNRFVQQAFIAGNDPQTLYFTKPITATDSYVGGALYLPAYVLPDDITNNTSVIVCDDPDWLVVATAAKIAFGDITYEDKVSDLNGEANALYNQMVKNNRRGVAGSPRVSATSVTRIGERNGRR